MPAHLSQSSYVFKMARILFYCFLATFTVVTLCAKTNVDPKVTEVPKDKGLVDQGSKESKEEFDLMATIMSCNESFRIEMSYLEALNESGSFPDETDKTPKCYLRCVLETLEVASMEGEYYPTRAAQVFAALRNEAPMDGIEIIATTCAERKESCKCERAYNFMKCMFSMEIEQYEKKN